MSFFVFLGRLFDINCLSKEKSQKVLLMSVLASCLWSSTRALPAPLTGSLVTLIPYYRCFILKWQGQMARQTPFEVDMATDYVRSRLLEPVIIAAANWIFIIINFDVMWMTFTSKDSTCSYLSTSTSRSVVNYVKAFNGRIWLIE